MQEHGDLVQQLLAAASPAVKVGACRSGAGFGSKASQHQLILDHRASELQAALENADAEVRYPFSAASPLAALADEFAHSPNHQRKIAELGQHGYTLRRRVRGDGNCFFRALGFAWLESVVFRAEAGEQLSLPFSWPSALCFGELLPEGEDLRRSLLLLVQACPKAKASQIGATLFERLLTDLRFDLCVVVLIRCLVAEHLLASSEDSDVRLVVHAQHGSVSEFVVSQVLPLGQEAEGVSLLAASCQLGVQLQIFQLDAQPGALADYVYPSDHEGSGSGTRIALLFRPGHYELIYHSSTPRFRESTVTMAKCSCCRLLKPLQTDELMVCFHRACSDCISLAIRSHNPGSAEPCLACLGAAPFPHRAVASSSTYTQWPGGSFWPIAWPQALRHHGALSPGRWLAASQASGTQAFPLAPGSLPLTTTPPVSAVAAVAAASKMKAPLRKSVLSPPVTPPAERVESTGRSEFGKDVTNLQNFEVPVPCENHCGFYGRAQTAGFCSRCFNEGVENDLAAVQERSKITEQQPEDAQCLDCEFASAKQQRLHMHHNDCLLRHVKPASSMKSLADIRLGAAPDLPTPRARLSSDSPRPAPDFLRPRSCLNSDSPIPTPRKMLSRHLQVQFEAALVASESRATGASQCLGCTCGFTCGTSAALDRHLVRFPNDARHQACGERPGLLTPRLFSETLRPGLSRPVQAIRNPQDELEDQATFASTISSASSSMQLRPVPPPKSLTAPWTLEARLSSKIDTEAVPITQNELEDEATLASTISSTSSTTRSRPVPPPKSLAAPWALVAQASTTACGGCHTQANDAALRMLHCGASVVLPESSGVYSSSLTDLSVLPDLPLAPVLPAFGGGTCHSSCSTELGMGNVAYLGRLTSADGSEPQAAACIPNSTRLDHGNETFTFSRVLQDVDQERIQVHVAY